MKRNMKIVFLDIDGVLVNIESLKRGSGLRAKAHPDCVNALNKIISETDARIVVSSTWRAGGVKYMRETLKLWGVEAKVRGITPDLRKAIRYRTDEELKLYLSIQRGGESPAL